MALAGEGASSGRVHSVHYIALLSAALGWQKGVRGDCQIGKYEWNSPIKAKGCVVHWLATACEPSNRMQKERR